jgi:tetratricopeptide (TPR) repeat protein
MKILGFAVLVVTVCTTSWSQSPKPDVEWDLVEQQLNVLHAAVQTRDIDATEKATEALSRSVSKEWLKSIPTPANRLQQAEDGAARGWSSPRMEQPEDGAARTHLKNRIGSLPNLATLAFQAGELEKAEQYARQTLADRSDAMDSIHAGNIVLGLIALKNDDVAGAETYLLAAARTKGKSVIMDRWGPNLALAKALLDKGQNDIVLEYFQSCKSFVTKNPKLDDGIAMLKSGRARDLSQEYLWHQ